MDFSQITTVIFDIGNTLVLVDHDQIVEAAAEQGAEITVESLKRAEHSGKLVVDNEVMSGNQDTDKDRWVKYFRAIAKEIDYPEHLIDELMYKIMERDKIRFGVWSLKNPEADDVLSELKNRGYKIGVISNADGRIQGLVDDLGLTKYFSIVIDSGVVGVEKPDPEIFNMALRELDCQPSMAIYVGDLYSVDVLGAKSVGITPLLIDPYNQYEINDCIKIRGLKEVTDYLPLNGPR